MPGSTIIPRPAIKISRAAKSPSHLKGESVVGVVVTWSVKSQCILENEFYEALCLARRGCAICEPFMVMDIEENKGRCLGDVSSGIIVIII